MLNLKEKYLIYFVALSAGALLLSNLAAVKLWNFMGIAVDGGIIVFPLTYILGDLIVEFYGKQVAKNVIWASFLVNLLAVLVFYIVILLPAYEGWNLQEAYVSILGFTPRIILGSLTAYICSNLLNNHIFMRLKNGTSFFSTNFIARALGSSTFAHMVDSFIFETIAFLGVLSLNEFILQAIFAYLLGMGFELILSPIEALIAKKFKVRLENDNL